MLYGGVAWSELPISTQRQEFLSGNEVQYSGIINTQLSESLQLNLQDDFALEINTGPTMEFLINTSVTQTLLVKTEIRFDLEIDPDNEWSLS